MNIQLTPAMLKYVVMAIAAILSSTGLYFGVKAYNKSIFDKGVNHQIEVQAALDALVDPIAEDLGQDTKSAEDTRNDKTNTIRTEVHTGITQAYLEKSRAEAQQTGKELGRAEAFAEYRAQGGCLTEPYAPDDKLLLNGKDQQRDIFGDVIRSDKADETE